MNVTPSDFFLRMETLLGVRHPSLEEFCCVCGRSLAGETYLGAGSGGGKRFACKPCYDEQMSPPIEPLDKEVAILDEHRIRHDAEFQDDMVAYVEALWGKKTFAFNVAVRDLEKMRRGQDDKSLREPATYHEALHLVRHVRMLANDIARHFDLVEIREEDDISPRAPK